MHDNNSLAHTSWNCKYHIVFAPKYRRKVFYGQYRVEVGKILRELCEWKGVHIIEAETPIIPIYTYTNERTFLACRLLQEKGVYVNPCVSPAVPVGQSLLRTSYTATHTKEQLDKAINAIAEVMEMLPPYNPEN